MTADLPTWIDQLRRFDDAALEALANRGLLRRARKDLERETVEFEQDGDVVQARTAGGVVTIGPSGPATATCSCPATAVCQHVLAALLALQASLAEVDGSANRDEPLADSATTHAELLAVPDEALVAHAGGTGYRWAWEAITDADPETDITISGTSTIQIRLRFPPIAAHYVGGGLGGIVVEQPPRDPRRLQVAAVLAHRRAHGLPIAEPAIRSRPARSGPTPQRDELRSQTRAALTGAVVLGLAHPSRPLVDRFATLAVWAQGVGYYRLALTLRRIAGGIELVLERSGTADTHALLDELARAYALVCALEATSGDEPSRLLGAARASYEALTHLELLGLGANRWRSASGYVGLTVVFWAPDRHEFLTCTDARPENVTSFDPAVRYRSAGPWTGLESPAAAAGRRLVLSGAELTSNGRLSAKEATHATLADLQDLAGRLPVVDDWAELRRDHARVRGLFDDADSAGSWTVIRPAAFGRPVFVEHDQTLHWSLRDASGAVLDAIVRYTAATAHTMARIDGLDHAALPEGTLLVARSSPRTGQVDPLSLIDPDGRVDSLSLDPGALAPPPATSTPVETWDTGDTSVDHPAMRPLVDRLVRHAERGVPPEQMVAVRDELVGLLAHASRAGFTLFDRLDTTDLAATVLKMRYLAEQYRLLTTP